MDRNYEYSNVEYVAMLDAYVRSGFNMNQARILYAQPENLNHLRAQGIAEPQIPAPNTFLAVRQRLLNHGQLRTPAHAQARGRPHYAAELEEDIIEYFERHPMRSTRMAARRFAVSQYYVWKILNSEGLHPFHFRKVHALYENDGPARIAFCQWILEHQNVNVLWTDESTFTRVGLYNQHNEHFWAFNNPHCIRESCHQVRFSVNVWAGIINDSIIGPYFIEGNLNGLNYLEMLREVIPNLMEDVPIAYLRDIFYQHDGCPAHYRLEVRRHLDEEFGDHWIGRGGPVAWPPRSPDLTPMDFFLWSQVKRLVFTEEAQTRDELRQKIIRAFETVKRDRDTLRKLKDNLVRRAHICIQPYRLPVKEHRERKTQDEKELEKRKLEIQERFRTKTGLLIDRDA
ncbi:uncharacterized protein LOC134670986 [Cydia fagiglandana]|uniref:uncharacterized protein LOC134670986 n=1 Tax=Cydia fagiglandana TaxID=1458189 RepID=UPI002FEE1412